MHRLYTRWCVSSNLVLTCKWRVDPAGIDGTGVDGADQATALDSCGDMKTLLVLRSVVTAFVMTTFVMTAFVMTPLLAILSLFFAYANNLN